METQIADEGLWSRRGQDRWRDKIRVKLNIDFCFASTVGLLPFSPGFCKRAIKYHKFHYCFFGNLIDKGMSAGNEHTLSQALEAILRRIRTTFYTYSYRKKSFFNVAEAKYRWAVAVPGHN